MYKCNGCSYDFRDGEVDPGGGCPCEDDDEPVIFRFHFGGLDGGFDSIHTHMQRQMEDMDRQMEDMFRNFGFPGMENTVVLYIKSREKHTFVHIYTYVDFLVFSKTVECPHSCTKTSKFEELWSPAGQQI